MSMAEDYDYDYDRAEEDLIHIQDCVIHAETAKAFLIRQPLTEATIVGVVEYYRQAWFPKSKSHYHDAARKFSYEAWLTPQWRTMATVYPPPSS